MAGGRSSSPSLQSEINSEAQGRGSSCFIKAPTFDLKEGDIFSSRERTNSSWSLFVNLFGKNDIPFQNICSQLETWLIIKLLRGEKSLADGLDVS